MQHEPPSLAHVPTLATPGRRFAARLIDVAPLLAVYFGLMGVFESATDVPGEVGAIVTFAVPLIVSFVAESVQQAVDGRSFGQRLLGLRVVRADDGGRVARDRVVKRALLFSPLPPLLVFFACGSGLFLLVDVLFPTWDKPLRQSLHDKLAGTIVIQESRH